MWLCALIARGSSEGGTVWGQGTGLVEPSLNTAGRGGARRNSHGEMNEHAIVVTLT